MPWGNRTHPDDAGRTPLVFGFRKCPRCGREITKNARGFRSHMRACLSKLLPGEPDTPEYRNGSLCDSL